MLPPSAKVLRYERCDAEEKEAMGVSSASAPGRLLALGLRLEEMVLGTRPSLFAEVRDLLTEIRDQNALLLELGTAPKASTRKAG